MKELEYPFDEEYILKKSKKIKKTLLEEDTKRIAKKIAVLGGSTTHDIIRILELFLLHSGIEPVFYESEYGMYWQDAMFDNCRLKEFAPDIIYIHTSNRNIMNYPQITDDEETVAGKVDQEYSHFEGMWEKLSKTYHCPIIQNNFELPFYRLLGNKDISDRNGRSHFIQTLNMRFYEYAQSHSDFYINDIQYLSACYGLDKWSDPFFWHMYKYALCFQAIPYLAFNVANIMKAIYGKNKKALVLDLDHTLWGGIVGDDGAENLEIGQETSVGQVYLEFQQYLKSLKQIGVLLTVDSKNDYENAIAGLNHPDGILRPEDFVVIKANWDPKSKNLLDTAKELNILPDSLVFADDNPAEREIVRQQGKGAAVPEIGSPEQYIRIIDHSGFFETIKLSEDDMRRNEMYRANAQRIKEQETFEDYGEYLQSLKMHAIIKPFESVYMARIAQLTNKSNQFNLTTKRYSQNEIEKIAFDPQFLTLYGKLEDKFGDNGVVSLAIGRIDGTKLHLELWLMSCRVLKRDMEYAMMDQVVRNCQEKGIRTIIGYYLPTAKNAMVKDFYELQGFTKESEDEDHNTVWIYEIPSQYEKKNKFITID